MAENIRCIDCGFLSFVQLYETNSLVGVTSQYRENGSEPPTYFVASHGERKRYADCPRCFIGAQHLYAERPGDGWSDGYEVATRERLCEQFEPCTPGLGPKEHFDIKLQRTLLETQEQQQREHREWLERQDVRDQAWRHSQAEREHEWRIEDQVREREWRKEDRSLAMSNLLVVVGVALISTIATLIAARMLPWFDTRSIVPYVVPDPGNHVPTPTY